MSLIYTSPQQRNIVWIQFSSFNHCYFNGFQLSYFFKFAYLRISDFAKTLLGIS